jgi:hypothetical protein
MIRTAKVLAAILALPASFALAQSSGPVAYIYVSSNYSGSENRVAGYAANAAGALTEISGSPWADNLSYLATSGSYLFGSTNIASDNGKNVFSYKVQSNGALKYIGANNIQDAGSENLCNVANNLMLDHTGAYLYIFVHDEGCNSNGGAYESFAVDKSTGLLNYLSRTDPTGFYSYPPTMLGNNDYAFAPKGDESDGSGEICGYRKAPNGALVFRASDGAIECSGSGSPGLAKSNGQYFCVAADPTNHLAASMGFTISTGAIVMEIATIAVNPANGAQSSKSTSDNMPASVVAYPSTSLAMAPGGKLVAIGGSNGIQIYSFNPLAQALPVTGLIGAADVTAMYWDDNNHLYAISNAGSTLQVFTVTATSAEEAPGSPYSIPNPVALTGHSM